MIYTELTRKAMIIAYNAHHEQFDKVGVPYIYHPIHLAEQMDTEEECICALLHDVVEDSDVTFEDLENEFPMEVIDVLKLLTHDKDEDYMEYVKRIKTNKVATKIKMADIKHNYDKSRFSNKEIPEGLKKKGELYKKAYEYLSE